MLDVSYPCSKWSLPTSDWCQKTSNGVKNDVNLRSFCTICRSNLVSLWSSWSPLCFLKISSQFEAVMNYDEFIQWWLWAAIPKTTFLDKWSLKVTKNWLISLLLLVMLAKFVYSASLKFLRFLDTIGVKLDRALSQAGPSNLLHKAFIHISEKNIWCVDTYDDSYLRCWIK